MKLLILITLLFSLSSCTPDKEETNQTETKAPVTETSNEELKIAKSTIIRKPKPKL